MILTDVKLRTVEIPLVMPITVKGHKIRTRRIAVIEAIDTGGRIGLGEIAPLPYLHKETLQEAVIQFREIQSEIKKNKIPGDIYPTVANALETALFDLSVKQNGFTVPADNRFLKVNGLLVCGTKDSDVALSELIENGFTSIKVKVGVDSLDEDIQLVRRLSHIARGKADLRIDANRRWSFDDAIKFSAESDCDVIEYIEEPLNDISLLPRLAEVSRIPVALDETLVEKGLEYANQIQRVKAWILKPSVLGGLAKTQAYVKYAINNSITPVISAAFPTSISIRAYAFFAAEMALGGTAHGFDTLKFLKTDTIDNLVQIKNGHIDLFADYG